MKLIVAAVFAVCCYFCGAFTIDYEEEERKYHQNLAFMFEERLAPLNKRLALEANYYTKGHFIITPQSMWYDLAPSGDNKEIFSFLNLPDDDSVKKQFYSRISMLRDVGEHYFFSSSRAIAVDETVDIKEDVPTYDTYTGMPDYLQSLKYEKPFGHVQKYISRYQTDVPYSGHTVMLDHSLFDCIGSPAFSGSTVLNGPFYNEHGEKIGTIEYLKMKDKFRVAHFPGNNVKVLEIPIGSRGHSMLFAVEGKAEDMIEAVFSGHIFSDLKQTEEHMEVVIPVLSMSSAIEMGTIFNNMRSSKVFSEPADTGNGDLPELPMGYYHMVTVNSTKSSSGKASEEANCASSENQCFIANKPFLFAMFAVLPKSDIKVPVFTGVYSYPGERGQQKKYG